MSDSKEPVRRPPHRTVLDFFRPVVRTTFGWRPQSRRVAVALVTVLLLAATAMTGRVVFAQPAYDFTFNLTGPVTATQGYPLYWDVESELLTGERQFAYFDAVNLPVGVSVSYPDLDERCCVGNRAYKPGPTLIRLLIDESATPGDYDVEFALTSNGVVRRAVHLLRIQSASQEQPDETSSSVTPALGTPDAAAGPNRRIARFNRTIVPSPPRANERQWRRRMLARGKELCNADEIAREGLWSGNVWFYDGIRVFHQIAAHTADPSWYACADYVKAVYLPYVINNQGRVPGYYVFTRGFLLDWLRTGDPQSKEAVLMLATKSPFAQIGGRVGNGLARETAFAIEAYLDAEAVGAARHPRLERAVAFALGHLDQWFVSSTQQEAAAVYGWPGLRSPNPVPRRDRGSEGLARD